MTIQQYETPAPLPASRAGDENLQGPVGRIARLRAAAEYAGYVANTAVVPEVLRGKPDEVAAVILTGEEVGLEPMAALRSVAMIKGVPSFKAEALRGLIVSHGHELWLEESTQTRAIAAGRRAGSDRVGRVTWTLDDAKRAGIAGQQNYQRYPREMLVARATAALARQMFADVVMGLVAAEELEAYDYNPNGATALPEPAAEPKPTTQRRRRQPAKPASNEDEKQEDPRPAAEPLPPTPPADEQPAPPEPLATEAYKRRIFATMRELDFVDRRARLVYTSRVVGREITSSNELTLAEASTLIDQLEADKAARAGGEDALVDEVLRAFDATIVSDEREAADSGQEGGDAPGEQAAADEPEAAKAEPLPYNEFPDEF